MAITVNGNEREYIEGETVSQLLLRMRYVFPMVIVKVNGKVIPKSEYGSTIIPDGASVDVIHLTSGG